MERYILQSGINPDTSISIWKEKNV